MGLPLADRTFVLPRRGDSALTDDAVQSLLAGLDQWSLEDDKLYRVLSFPDFRSALAFTNRVGELAETVGHHPHITLTWGRVEIRLWTHDVGGLTEADFILAARLDTVV